MRARTAVLSLMVYFQSRAGGLGAAPVPAPLAQQPPRTGSRRPSDRRPRLQLLQDVGESPKSPNHHAPGLRVDLALPDLRIEQRKVREAFPGLPR